MRYSHILTAIATLLALSALGVAVWLAATLSKENTALSELRYEYESAVQRNTYASSVRSLLRDIEDERDKLYEISSELDPVDIIKFVENVGKTAGTSVIINAVSPGTAPEEDPTLSSFLITLNSEGSFKQLFHLVTLLETLPFPSEIEKVRFEKLERKWNMSSVVRVYTEDSI